MGLRVSNADSSEVLEARTRECSVGLLGRPDADASGETYVEQSLPIRLSVTV